MVGIPEKAHALGPAELGGAQVAGEDEHRIAEVHRASVAIREASVVQHLEQDVEHLRVGLLDLVEEDHAEGAAAHGLRQLAALVVAHVARRRSNESGSGVLLHVLGHVDAHHGIFIVEEEVRQGACQLGLSDARGSQKHEGADGPFGVLETGPRTANGFRHNLDGPLLPDDAPVQALLHVEQAGGLSLQEARYRHAGPLGDQARDILLAHAVIELLLPEPGVPLGGEVPLEGEPLGADAGRPLIVAPLTQGLLLVLELQAAPLDGLEVAWHAGHIEPQLGCGLIHQVHRLVRQMTPSNVAFAEADGGHKGVVVDVDLVVGLVTGLEGVHHLDSRLRGGLFDPDGVEAPLQRWIALDVLSVVVRSSGADDLDFAACEGGLHHIGGIDAALGGAGAHHGVDLIDEEDDLPPAGLDLVQYGLETLLELAAELGAGHETGHVEGQNAAVLYGVGDVAGDDCLGESLGDGGLAHAGLAQQDGVVLGAPRECLDNAADLLLPSHDGVQLPLTSKGGQVNAVPLQRPVAALRPGVRDTVRTPHLGQGLIDLLRVNAKAAEDLGRLAAALLHDADEQVLGADVVVLEAVRLCLGDLQQARGARGRVYLPRLVGQLGYTLQGILQPCSNSGGIHTQFPEDLRRDALLLVQQRQEDVLHIPLRVAVASDQLLGASHDLLGRFCEAVRSQNHDPYLPKVFRHDDGAAAYTGRRGPWSRGVRSRSTSDRSASMTCSISWIWAMRRRTTSAPARLTPMSSIRVLMRRTCSMSRSE